MFPNLVLKKVMTIWLTFWIWQRKKYSALFSSPKSQKYINLKDALPEAWERLERLHEHKDALRGLSTGFRDLDNNLSGLQKSDLIIIAARPSIGKTTLALDIARMASINHDKSVLIFSLEMSSPTISRSNAFGSIASKCLEFTHWRIYHPIEIFRNFVIR